MLQTLPRVIAAPAGKPVRDGVAEGQARARRLALRPGTWDRDEAAGMAARFDEAAPDWESDGGGYRRPPLADALSRGGPFAGGSSASGPRNHRHSHGRAAEIASGTGLMTPLIQDVWPEVVALDLSPGMLGRARHGARIQADASRLPLADGCADAVVICDGPLFAAEVTRVLAPGAPLVGPTALGRGAPPPRPAAGGTAALAAAAGHPWRAVQSEAHWGPGPCSVPSDPPAESPPRYRGAGGNARARAAPARRSGTRVVAAPVGLGAAGGRRGAGTAGPAHRPRRQLGRARRGGRVRRVARRGRRTRSP